MWFHYSFINNFNYHPQTKFAKVMFLHVSVCPRGGVVSQHALQVVSQYALQVSRRGVVSQHAMQVSRPTPRGEVEGPGLGGVSRPTPGGWWSPGPHLGGSPGPHMGESPGPHWGELRGLAWVGGIPGPHLVSGLQTDTQGGIPACTEADPPPPSRRPLLLAVRILLECILVK